MKVWCQSAEINSPSFTTIGHCEKHCAVNSQNISVSECLQNSTYSRTQANRSFEASIACWLDQLHKTKKWVFTFIKEIAFSDDVHFQLNGYVNKQIFRNLCTENPKIIYVKPLRPQWATICCRFQSRILGCTFLEIGMEI